MVRHTHWSNSDISNIGVTSYFLIEFKRSISQDKTQYLAELLVAEPVIGPRESITIIPLNEYSIKQTLKDLLL